MFADHTLRPARPMTILARFRDLFLNACAECQMLYENIILKIKRFVCELACSHT